MRPPCPVAAPPPSPCCTDACPALRCRGRSGSRTPATGSSGSVHRYRCRRRSTDAGAGARQDRRSPWHRARRRKPPPSPRRHGRLDPTSAGTRLPPSLRAGGAQAPRASATRGRYGERTRAGSSRIDRAGPGELTHDTPEVRIAGIRGVFRGRGQAEPVDARSRVLIEEATALSHRVTHQVEPLRRFRPARRTRDRLQHQHVATIAPTCS